MLSVMRDILSNKLSEPSASSKVMSDIDKEKFLVQYRNVILHSLSTEKVNKTEALKMLSKYLKEDNLLKQSISS